MRSLPLGLPPPSSPAGTPRTAPTASSTATDLELIEGPRHPGGAAHGSGCTHSSALAARLALGDTPLEAARAARQIASEAVANGLRDLGSGAGPVDVLGTVRDPAGDRQA